MITSSNAEGKKKFITSNAYFYSSVPDGKKIIVCENKILLFIRTIRSSVKYDERKKKRDLHETNDGIT